MMKTLILSLLLVTGIVAFSVVIASQKATETPILKAELLVSAETGWPVTLLVTGFNPRENAWLGVSQYPYGVTDPIAGGKHSITKVGKGSFKEEIPVNADFLGGSFETALWGKRIDKVDCTLDNCYWCKSFGFHVDELLIYKSGLYSRLTGYK